MLSLAQTFFQHSLFLLRSRYLLALDFTAQGRFCPLRALPVATVSLRGLHPQPALVSALQAQSVPTPLHRLFSALLANGLRQDRVRALSVTLAVTVPLRGLPPLVVVAPALLGQYAPVAPRRPRCVR